MKSVGAEEAALWLRTLVLEDPMLSSAFHGHCNYIDKLPHRTYMQTPSTI